MEQVQIFLSDNSGWIIMGIDLLTFILLVVTLHRTNKLSKQMRKITDDRVTRSEGMAQPVNAVAAAAASQMDSQACADSMQPSQRNEETPETLIHAVIDEVFS